MAGEGLLGGVRVVDVSILAPSAAGMHFGDLGAEVIKVEDPSGGDYVRDIARRDGEPVSDLHRQWNRGKRSVAIDLRDPAGVADFLALVASADILIEGMRPGALERRGLGYERLLSVRPDLVFINLSGFGQSGPYAALPAHGPSFDAYAGLCPPVFDAQGYPQLPPMRLHVGITVTPLYAVMAGLAALTRARATGAPARIDIAQADAAAYFNAFAVNGAAAPLAPVAPVANGGEGFSGPVLLQYYRTADDRIILFQAIERKFFERFARAVERYDLLSAFADGQEIDLLSGNRDMHAQLTSIFATRSLTDWMALFMAADIPGVPVNDADQLLTDPNFAERARWLDTGKHGVAMLGFPALVDAGLPDPRPAPALGEHSAEILGVFTGTQSA